ncbi:hypothetical protein Ade02nite_40680 [Paractinoplanes deccanensis]|uniref:Uncharacterized protein n=1 Tax=Paractinoplanes deccanensis TaxID=113561 RepID=A0ABQ3Y613_9ACTN|nr:hypothetical protein Ade02nite_40680 [Actinoplanes deccanensis]
MGGGYRACNAVECCGHRLLPARGDVPRAVTAFTSLNRVGTKRPKRRRHDDPPYTSKGSLTKPNFRTNTLRQGELTFGTHVAGFVKVSVGNALVARCGHARRRH